MRDKIIHKRLSTLNSISRYAWNVAINQRFLSNFIFIHQKYSKGLYNFFVLVFKGQIW